jgi:hypothetical protein
MTVISAIHAKTRQTGKALIAFRQFAMLPITAQRI